MTEDPKRGKTGAEMKMTEKKLKKTKTSPSSKPSASNLTAMSTALWVKGMDIVKAMVEAGASNFVQGIASTVIVADMLHSAGLLSDPANAGITLLLASDTAIAEAKSIFGIFTDAAAVFTPQLKTKVHQEIKESATGAKSAERTVTSEGPAQAALNAAATLAEIAAVA